MTSEIWDLKSNVILCPICAKTRLLLIAKIVVTLSGEIVIMSHCFNHITNKTKTHSYEYHTHYMFDLVISKNETYVRQQGAALTACRRPVGGANVCHYWTEWKLSVCVFIDSLWKVGTIRAVQHTF